MGGGGAVARGKVGTHNLLKGPLHPGPKLLLGAGKGPSNTFSSDKV